MEILVVSTHVCARGGGGGGGCVSLECFFFVSFVIFAHCLDCGCWGRGGGEDVGVVLRVLCNVWTVWTVW